MTDTAPTLTVAAKLAYHFPTEARALQAATAWGEFAPTEFSFEPVMKPDGRYVVACIEQTPDGARLRGYL